VSRLKKNELQRMFLFEREHWWYRSLHAFLLRQIKLDSGAVVIDLGAGSGYFSSLLAREYSASVSAIDISRECSEEAQSLGVEAVNCSIEDYLSQMKPATADLVLFLDSFYFLGEAEQIQALTTAYSTLKPGGCVIFHLPAGRLFRREHDQTVNIRHRFSKKNVMELIERAKISEEAEIRMRYRICALSTGILARKALQRIFASSRPRSDLFSMPRWLQSSLHCFQRLEDKLQDVPWGSSLYAEIRRSVASARGLRAK